MSIGTHLASLNLFREEDGSLWITCSGHSPALMEEFRKAQSTWCLTPADYVDQLVIKAAVDMQIRAAVGIKEPRP